MIQRILKIELLLLFFFTICSFYYFYFFSAIPDNIFSISSSTSQSSFFSYYFYSLISIIGFFIGPWIFFPFITFSLFYSFMLSKRSFIFDSLILLVGSVFYLGVCNYFFPESVGDGLHLLISKYLGTVNLFIASLITFSLSLFMIFRMGFITFLKKCGLFVLACPSHIKSFFLSLNNTRITTQNFFKRAFSYIKLPKLNKRVTESFTQEKVAEEIVQLKDDKPFSSSDLVEQKTNACTAQKVTIGATETLQTELAPSSELAGKVESKATPNLPRRKPVQNVNYKEFLKDSIAVSNRAKQQSDPDHTYFAEITSALEEKLQEFKIDGKIINILKGPVVDTFELELGPGVKVSKVLGLSNDLSLALAGAPIRIEHTTVGRTTIGIEVPRDPRDYIYLDEVINSDEYKKNIKMKLPLAMGYNVIGESYVIDLASAPHMLVAGETGSGKSVFVHSLLVSLLMKKSPQSLRLIMIDPKQIEMMPYTKLPHLLMPVITQDKEASLALMWACQEMEKRYSILREFEVRNIEGFNEKLKDATPDMLANIHQYYEDDNFELPLIVVVVDEYADLILGPAGKEIEMSICRLGQKARAAGIHVILTTQRPSANVVTGLIKANFPTRVSLKVSSAIDSRVILDKNGAEKLLGNGDMLYKKGTELVRIHSPFVSVDEVAGLVKKLSQLEVSFNSGAMEFLESGGTDSELLAEMNGSAPSSNISDELFQQAVDFVLTQKLASTSSLQRKFRIGYNKAADLIEALERRGVVGPAQGSKGREILGGPSPQ